MSMSCCLAPTTSPGVSADHAHIHYAHEYGYPASRGSASACYASLWLSSQLPSPSDQHVTLLIAALLRDTGVPASRPRLLQPISELRGLCRGCLPPTASRCDLEGVDHFVDMNIDVCETGSR